MNLSFPYQIDGRGRTREAERDEFRDEYIKELIEHLLFTAPGERLMRPDFGSGINELLFASNSPELAATTQMLIQGVLQQWLGNLIIVNSVAIETMDSTLTIDIQYTVRQSQQIAEAHFKREVQG